MARHNWELIEEVYIAGKMDANGAYLNYSYSDIAKMFGIASMTIQRHAEKHNWHEKRDKHKITIQKVTMKKLKQQMLSTSLKELGISTKPSRITLQELRYTIEQYEIIFGLN